MENIDKYGVSLIYVFALIVFAITTYVRLMRAVDERTKESTKQMEQRLTFIEDRCQREELRFEKMNDEFTRLREDIGQIKVSLARLVGILEGQRNLEPQKGEIR